MPEKKIIAKSEATYRNFIIYELGEAKFGIIYKGKLLDDFVSLGEVKAFIDAYYAQKNYPWN